MKRFICTAALLFMTVCLLCSCADGNIDKADGMAKQFTESMLARDVQTLSTLTHPDHIDEVVYDDPFFEQLEFYGLTGGETLEEFYVGSKRYETDESLGGEVYVCDYVALVDQVPYDVMVVFLDNENGFGIIAASVDYCKDVDYYDISE